MQWNINGHWCWEWLKYSILFYSKLKRFQRFSNHITLRGIIIIRFDFTLFLKKEFLGQLNSSSLSQSLSSTTMYQIFPIISTQQRLQTSNTIWSMLHIDELWRIRYGREINLNTSDSYISWLLLALLCVRKRRSLLLGNKHASNWKKKKKNNFTKSPERERKNGKAIGVKYKPLRFMGIGHTRISVSFIIFYVWNYVKV